jgi:hypothetical protein
MSWFGVLLMAAGAVLLLLAHGDTAHSLGVATLIVGAALIVLAAVRAALRLIGLRRRVTSGLRYQDREDFSGGIPADYRTSRGKIAAMVLVLVYLFSPIDLAVLELLLPVGIVGDTGALAWLALTTGKELTRHRQARKVRRSLRAAEHRPLAR